jgi:cytochrome P450 PksS
MISVRSQLSGFQFSALSVSVRGTREPNTENLRTENRELTSSSPRSHCHPSYNPAVFVRDLASIDLTDPWVQADPYPVFDRLRTEAPVCRLRVGRWLHFWMITRYDDVVSVLKDERFTHDFRKVRRADVQIVRLLGPLTRHMLNRDPPDHTRLRVLVQKAFTPRFVEGLRPRIESLAEELLDRVARQGRMDVVADYALPLPVTIIAEMLGVPVSDRDRFQRWTARLVEFGGAWSIIRSVPSGWSLLDYIRGLVRIRRRQPEADLISALVAAEEAGDKLTESEVWAMVGLLLLAGYETTVNLIANGTLALLGHPEQMHALHARPSLAPAAVEELLRYDGPLNWAPPRWARCDVEVAGVMIPKHAAVALGLNAADRDPAQFRRPDVLDFQREPNRHLALGQGVHYCVGAPLARLESQIAFTTLLRRLPDLRLAVPREALPWRRSVPLRGLRSLPVSFG